MNASEIVGWNPEPQTRGTIGLVWGCLVTIFLCTWNAIHPNLPAEKDSAQRIFWRRVGYLVAALIAPEYICGEAIEQLAHARAVQAICPNWSLAQCFFLCMGGFVADRDGVPIRIPPKQLLGLIETQVVSVPDGTKEEIQDRSKADWILKTFALAQTIWFIAQVIGRAAQGLSVTTLELFTLGIISCTLITYLAWWSKPFDIRRPILLHADKRLPSDIKPDDRVALLTTSGDAISHSEWPIGMAFFATLVFGALHLVGWRFHFPTEAEQWLWRASSIACVALPLAAVAFGLWYGGKCIQIGWAILGLYAFSRCFMMVEMFISLRAVPADVYQTPQWSQYFLAFG